MEQEIDWQQEIWGQGYPRIEREQFRRKKGDFWDGINAIGTDGTIMMEWERRFGTSIELVKPFLKPTGQAQDHIACPASSSCGCAHYVSENLRGELMATCQCDGEDWDCETYQLEPEDVLMHGLDWVLFAAEVRKVLGFATPMGAAYVSSDLREIGTYSAVAVPVYLSLAGEQALLRELVKLQGLREGPFLVLTATGRTWSEAVEAMARPHGGGHISLSSVVEVRLPIDGGWRPTGALEPMLAEFSRRVASLRETGGTLKNIHREIAAVRQDFGELRTAKQRLEKMQADGLFTFTNRVDAKSFKVVCAILATGNVARASRVLRMKDASVRTIMRRWRSGGKDYRALLELVRWRKTTAKNETFPLNDAVLHESADATDYPGLISDLLDVVLSVTEDNWEGKCEELAEMLRAARR